MRSRSTRGQGAGQLSGTEQAQGSTSQGPALSQGQLVSQGRAASAHSRGYGNGFIQSLVQRQMSATPPTSEAGEGGGGFVFGRAAGQLAEEEQNPDQRDPNEQAPNERDPNEQDPNAQVDLSMVEVGEGMGEAWSDGCSQNPDGNPSKLSGDGAGASPIELTVSNDYPDPASGGNFNRTTVGVGERATFDAPISEDTSAAVWTASGGTGNKSRDGLYNWQAPGSPGSYTITFTLGDRTATTTMTVVAPTGITSTGSSGLPTTRAGAGMLLEIVVNPLTVSFAEAEIYEVPGPGVGTGYFRNRTLSHGTAQGAGSWVWLDHENHTQDRAFMSGWPGPWSPGTHTWTIPTHYRAPGGASTLFHTSSQVFTVTNAAGDATISKFNHSA